MARNNKAFSPETYSVLIPYKDLVCLLDAVAQMEEIEQHMKRMEERSVALQGLYSELLGKVTALNQYI